MLYLYIMISRKENIAWAVLILLCALLGYLPIVSDALWVIALVLLGGMAILFYKNETVEDEENVGDGVQ
jgi:hypothetical protein